jgi:hypothetical protein
MWFLILMGICGAFQVLKYLYHEIKTKIEIVKAAKEESLKIEENEYSNEN